MSTSQLEKNNKIHLDDTPLQGETMREIKSALKKGCETGDVGLIREVLNSKKIELDGPEHKEHLLNIACSHGHPNVVSNLLHYGAQIDRQDTNGWSPLMHACSNGHCQLAEFLLKKDTQIDLQTKDGWTALMLACENGHNEAIHVLLKNEVQVDQQKHDGVSALMIASNNAHVNIVQVLIENGATVNLQNTQGSSALMYASQNGQDDTVKTLLANGAQVDLQNNKGWYALMHASQKGSEEVVKTLLENGAQTDLLSIKGLSALMIASSNGHAGVVKLLLQTNKALVDLQQEVGWSALMYASQDGCVEITKILLENGAEVNLRDEDGFSALIIASHHGQAKVVKLLLENGAQIDLQGNNGRSALMCASLVGHCEVVKTLLENGANPDIQDIENKSAIILATEAGHQRVISMLKHANTLNTNKIFTIYTSIRSGSSTYPYKTESTAQVFLSDHHTGTATSQQGFTPGPPDQKPSPVEPTDPSTKSSTCSQPKANQSPSFCQQTAFPKALHTTTPNHVNSSGTVQVNRTSACKSFHLIKSHRWTFVTFLLILITIATESYYKPTNGHALHSKPTLNAMADLKYSNGYKDLHIIELISPYCDRLGYMLGLSNEVVQALQIMTPTDTDSHTETCKDILGLWLDGQGNTPATWDSFIQALDQLELGELSSMLREIMDEH